MEISLFSKKGKSIKSTKCVIFLLFFWVVLWWACFGNHINSFTSIKCRSTLSLNRIEWVVTCAYSNLPFHFFILKQSHVIIFNRIYSFNFHQHVKLMITSSSSSFFFSFLPQIKIVIDIQTAECYLFYIIIYVVAWHQCDKTHF